MNKLYSSVITVLLSAFSVSTMAHIDLSTVDGEDCSGGKCKINALHLQSGSSIEVVYDVEIVHDTNVKLVFINNGVSIVLKENLPEPVGLTAVTVSLPDVQCDPCSLRVEQSVYQGTANIVLSKNGWVAPEPDPEPEPEPDMGTGTKKSGGSVHWSFLLVGCLIAFWRRRLKVK